MHQRLDHAANPLQIANVNASAAYTSDRDSRVGLAATRAGEFTGRDDIRNKRTVRRHKRQPLIFRREMLEHCLCLGRQGIKACYQNK